MRFGKLRAHMVFCVGSDLRSELVMKYAILSDELVNMRVPGFFPVDRVC